MRWAFLVLLGLLLSMVARAEEPELDPPTSYFFAEPYLGANYGRFLVDSSGGGIATQRGDVLEGVIGARTGFRFAEWVLVGLNFRYGMGSQKEDSLTQGNSVQRVTVGLIAGVWLPESPWRFWGGFDFFDRSLVDVSRSSSVATASPEERYTGTGMRLGVSYFIGTFLGLSDWALNLEYEYHVYSSMDRAGTTTVYPRQIGSFTQAAPMFHMGVLSLSLPFKF